jgi:hypothetical protein
MSVQRRPLDLRDAALTYILPRNMLMDYFGILRGAAEYFPLDGEWRPQTAVRAATTRREALVGEKIIGPVRQLS